MTKAAVLTTALFIAATCAAFATTQATMAPIAQYRIADRGAEIALARTAAPAAISAKASVLVMGARGYETAAKGSNGFTCLVERAWMSPFDAGAEFWNPRNRSPICYNPAATRTVLPYTLKRTQLALAGASRADMLKATQAAVARKELLPPAPGAMSYMMSKQQYLNDQVGAWRPHLMFHVPLTDAASWAANEDGSPIMQDSAHQQGPEPETIFMMAARHWSDGSTPDAPGMAMHH